jgi:Lrp/AsnC family leucine-responsive transcriptional regulator
MDERDVRLLKAIADLESGSPEKLHEETGIPTSTIHYRLNRLREEGIVENDTYDVDLAALGLDVTVIVDVLATYTGSFEDVGEKLAAIEGVSQVHFTMGETDFAVVAHLSGRAMVERLISDFETIPEVDRTNSTFVVTTIKDDHSALQSYSLETLVAELVDE